MPALQEIYDKNIEDYTIENDWLYYLDKNESLKHYIPYVYKEATISFFKDFKNLMSKTDLSSQIKWNDERCAFTIFETTFILACMESMYEYTRTYEDKDTYKNDGKCITPVIFYDYQEHSQCFLYNNSYRGKMTKDTVLRTYSSEYFTEIVSAGMCNRFINSNQAATSRYSVTKISGVYDYQIHVKSSSSIRNENDSKKINFKYGIVIHYNNNFFHIAYKPSQQFYENGMNYYMNDKLPLIFVCKGINKINEDPILYITADPNSTFKQSTTYINSIQGINYSSSYDFLKQIYYSYKPLNDELNVYCTIDENGNIYGATGNYGYGNICSLYRDNLNSSSTLSVTHHLYEPKTKKDIAFYNVNPYYLFNLIPEQKEYIDYFISKENNQIFMQKLQTRFGWAEFDNIYNVQETEDLYYQDAYFTINGETYYKSSNNYIGFNKHKNSTPVFLLKI